MSEISKLHLLDSVTFKGLVHSVKNLQKTDELIAWLRAGNEVTPQLAMLIADVLEGKINAKHKPKNPMDWLTPSTLRGYVEFLQELIKNGGDPEIGINEIRSLLKQAGIEGQYPEKKGARTKAAKQCTAYNFGLTLSQLDERMIRRKRNKRK